MSKRKLLALVNEGHVAGWDDPRLPTLAAQRRRGVRPEAIRTFAEKTGVSKVDGRIDLALYEHSVRDDLNGIAPRVLAVTRPLKLVLTNVPDGAEEWIEAPLWPHDVTPPEGARATRRLPFGREVWVEADDFMATPVKGWHRLAPGAEVRLRHAYVVRCTEAVTGADGQVAELRGEIVPDTRAGQANDGYRTKGVIHWVGAAHAVPARFRLYDRLFTEAAPDALDDFRDALNRHSLTETDGFVEPYAATLPADTRVQCERLGFFWPDPVDSRPDALVYNRIVGLRDSWAKQQAVAPPTRVAPVAPTPPAATDGPARPRDPAEGLHGQARAWFDALSEEGVGAEEAAVLAQDDTLRALYEEIVAVHANERLAGSFVVSDLRRALAGHSLAETPATPRQMGLLLRLVDQGAVTRTAARDVLTELIAHGGETQSIVHRLGLAAITDDAALLPHVDSVLAAFSGQGGRVPRGQDRLARLLYRRGDAPRGQGRRSEGGAEAAARAAGPLKWSMVNSQ